RPAPPRSSRPGGRPNAKSQAAGPGRSTPLPCATGPWASPLSKLATERSQPLHPLSHLGPDQLAQRVEEKREKEEEQSRDKKHPVKRAAHGRFGHLHGDVGRKGSKTVKDVEIHDRRVARGH